MENVLVINLTTVAQHVGVLHADGKPDDVQIMPKQKVELRKGMTVNVRWLGLNPNVVKVINPQPAPKAVTKGETK